MFGSLQDPATPPPPQQKENKRSGEDFTCQRIHRFLLSQSEHKSYALMQVMDSEHHPNDLKPDRSNKLSNHRKREE